LSPSSNNKEILKAEVRLYTNLFDIKEPSKEDNWEKFINLNSEVVISEALVDPCFEIKSKRNIFEKYQFERLGFFSVDTDTTDEKLVFNRTVSLKESYSKFK
jgi:glutaminyl-tRNA synthetase